MKRVEITEAADRDLEKIYEYTFREQGEQQADRYLQALRDVFSNLADTPGLARTAERIRPGYRRFETGRHSIFLVRVPGGIQVIRVLHQSMDPTRHL